MIDRRLAVEQEVAAALVDAGVIGREQLRMVLQGGTPRTEDATLLSILQGLGIVAKVLADLKGALGRRDLKRRIADVADEIPSGMRSPRPLRP